MILKNSWMMFQLKTEQTFGNEQESVVVVDTGAKNAILRNIRELGTK